MKNSVLFLLFGALAAVTLNAQGTVGAPGSGGPTQPNGQAVTNPSFAGDRRGPDALRPINLFGKVVIEGGGAPLQNIAIERVCSGISKAAAYTDSKGHFSFEWGDRNRTVVDAADAGSGPRNTGTGVSQANFGSNPLAVDPFGNRMVNCVLRANLAGYSSDAIELFNKQVAENPDVGTIILHRTAGVEGTSLSVTSAMAPKDARKAYDHGLQSLLKNKPDTAARYFEKAVAIYPKYADAWANLGKVRLAQQSIEPARAALKQAIESDPKLVTPYVELGFLAEKEGNWQESGKYLDRAVELDPVDYPPAWYADALAHYSLKQYDAAEKSARAAVKLDPRHDNPRARYMLGMILAEKRDYAGALAELNEFVKLAPHAPDLAQVKDRIAQFEKLMAGSK